jgi:hypothetical protein
MIVINDNLEYLRRLLLPPQNVLPVPCIALSRSYVQAHPHVNVYARTIATEQFFADAGP